MHAPGLAGFRVETAGARPLPDPFFTDQPPAAGRADALR
jgi:L-ascorbate metabolism protein UlaG (beta-lactamase superfamily)